MSGEDNLEEAGALLTRITQAVELGCDEKTEWTELLNARRTANYKNELFESAARTAVSKTPYLSYGDKKTHTASILIGRLAAVQITGALLLEVGSVFVRLIEESKKSAHDEHDRKDLVEI